MSDWSQGLEKVIFDRGDLLFSEGDAHYFFFVIQQGEVDIFLPETSNSSEIHLATLGPGQAVGEFALVVKKPRSASARARTPCTAIKISEKTYQSLLQELPAWSISVLESLIDRLRKTDGMLRDQRMEVSAMLARFEQLTG